MGLTATSRPRGGHMTRPGPLKNSIHLTVAMAQEWTFDSAHLSEPALELLLELCGKRYSLFCGLISCKDSRSLKLLVALLLLLGKRQTEKGVNTEEAGLRDGGIETDSQ